MDEGLQLVLIQYLILHQPSRLLALRRSSALDPPTAMRLEDTPERQGWNGCAHAHLLSAGSWGCWTLSSRLLPSCSGCATYVYQRPLGVDKEVQGTHSALSPTQMMIPPARYQRVMSEHSSSSPATRAVVDESAAANSLGLSNPSNACFTVPSTFLQS